MAQRDGDMPESGVNVDVFRPSGKCGDAACVCTYRGTQFLWVDTAAHVAPSEQPALPAAQQ